MEHFATKSGERIPRITLGPGAPEGIADFIGRTGIEVLPLSQRHQAALYVDFVGARPSGNEVLSIALKDSTSLRPDADLVTDSWPAAACLIVSRVIGLRPPLLTADNTMLSVIKTAIGVAGSHIPMILTGEVGTGKCNLARLIHQVSGSRGSFLSADCACFEHFALDTSLIPMAEDTRATGAIPPTTVFLNDIGQLSDLAQTKLLRMLQPEPASAVRPELTLPAARFIGATNRSTSELIECGHLRSELFWRLNVFTLLVPPLRQRQGDIPLLARYFLRKANPRRIFAPMALKVMAGYAFPGNLLELENLVTRLAMAPLTDAGHIIDVPDLRRHLMVAADNERSLTGWKSSRETARREMILQTIAAAGGNRVEAARRLGITLRALQYHITKAGLSRRRSATPVNPAPAPELLRGNTWESL